MWVIGGQTERWWVEEQSVCFRCLVIIIEKHRIWNRFENCIANRVHGAPLNRVIVLMMIRRGSSSMIDINHMDE